MSEKFVVGYDGSDASKRALDFALKRARSASGPRSLKSVTSAGLKNWSVPNRI